MEKNRDGKEHSTLKEDNIANDLLSFLSTSFLPSQSHSLDQPLEANSFKEHVKNCQANFEKAISVLENHRSLNLNKKLIINLILLCGEHSRNDLWTSPQTVIYAEKLLKSVIERFGCKSAIDLMQHNKLDLFFSELRPKLLKNTWKNNPAAVACFIWILYQIKCPDLGDVLNSVLPTCLLLVDDHEYSNKIKGLQCLEHLTNNVSRAELNQYGRGLVIYNALEHIIYLREPEIIPPLGACLTALLRKTEQGSTKENLSWTHFDDVLKIWLPSMEMEQKLLLRKAYIESLNSLLQAMGLASVRWSKKLFGILSEYSEQDHTRDEALLNLLTFMKTTWPRLSSNFEPIVVILMKIAIKTSNNSSCDKLSQPTQHLISQCSALLETHCKEQFDSFASEMKNCGEMRDCFLLITRHQGEDCRLSALESLMNT